MTGFGRLLISRFTGIRLLPGQVVALAAMGLILLGACFLMLPFATNPGVHLRFIDALFTATSAVCVTGLFVLDTPQDFTAFGQGVILFLIQIGGLGYALMATLILLMLGRRLGLRDRMMLSETMSTMGLQGLVRFAKRHAVQHVQQIDGELVRRVAEGRRPVARHEPALLADVGQRGERRGGITDVGEHHGEPARGGLGVGAANG